MKGLFLFLAVLIGLIAALPLAGFDLIAGSVGEPCSPAGAAESLLNLALLVGGAFVPGAAWLAQLAKGRKLAKVADDLAEVISQHPDDDRLFLSIAESEHLGEAVIAVQEIIQSKGAV